MPGLTIGDLFGLVPGIITQTLDRLAITVGGVYTPPGSLPVVTVTTGVGSETVLTTGQSGALVKNTGTTVKASCLLPASPTVGHYYDFLVDDADGLRVVANTGQTITVGELGVSASAGYVESVRQESGFRLTCTAANTWRASRIDGTWRKDSTTSAGFAFTPTAWTAFTPTGSWSTNTTYTGLYRQSGNNLELLLGVATSGAPTSANLTINFPSGYTSASSLPVVSNGRMLCGVGYTDNTPNVAAVIYPWVATSATSVIICYPTAFAAGTWANVTQAAPFSWGAGDSLTLTVSVPVQ